MIYGTYLSAQGAEFQSKRLDVLSNNLANASTTGFKRQLALAQAHAPFDVENGSQHAPPGNLNESTGGVTLAGVATDFSDAAMIPTGGTYDVALTGPGFLHVSDGEQEFLTRNGQLTVNSLRELVTLGTGAAVLAVGGSPITIPKDVSSVEITSDGTILGRKADGSTSTIDQLALVRPKSFDELQKVGNSFYRTDGEVLPVSSGVSVQQGFLEASGTQPVIEMVELIGASRAFETNINMIKFQDEALGQLLQSVTR